MKVTGATVQQFRNNKQGPFKRVLSQITGQPPEWVMVNATSVAAAASRRRRSLLQSAAAPISLQSEVHALEADVGDVQPRMQAAVADGSLASMLQGIGLTLVPDSVVYGTPAPPPPLPPSPPAPESSGSSSVTTIVVPVVCSVGGLALVALAVFFWMRRKKKKQAEAEFVASRQERRASGLITTASAAPPPAPLPVAPLVKPLPSPAPRPPPGPSTSRRYQQPVRQGTAPTQVAMESAPSFGRGSAPQVQRADL